MAVSDYAVSGVSEAFCPMAMLTGPIGPLDVVALTSGYRQTAPNDRFLGMAGMLGDEIVQVIGISGSNLTLHRGCADTIPQSHVGGTLFWFFDQTIGSNNVVYPATATLSVKILPATAAGTKVPVGGSPPNDITFNRRLVRPYPPGLVRANGVAWFEQATIDDDTDLVLTWVHRNRVLQGATLRGHIESSVAPEDGQTYKVQLFSAGSILVASYEGIADETWTYTRAMAVADFAVTFPEVEGYLLLMSVRDGYESLQKYRIDFSIAAATSSPYGLGYRLGESLGGVEP